MRPSRNDLLIKAFSSVLKARRLALGLTYEDLAGAIELDRPDITLIESAAKQPSLSVVWRLAAGLQITMSDLAAKVDVQLARLQSPPTAAGAKKVATQRKP